MPAPEPNPLDAWRTPFPKHSAAESFQTAALNILRASPELIGKIHLLREEEDGAPLLTLALGARPHLRLTLALDDAHLAPLSPREELAAARRALSTVAAARLLIETLPADAVLEVDVGSGRSVISAAGWGEVERALAGLGIPIGAAVQSSAGASVSCTLPGWGPDIVTLEGALRHRGALAEERHRLTSGLEPELASPLAEVVQTHVERKIREKHGALFDRLAAAAPTLDSLALAQWTGGRTAEESLSCSLPADGVVLIAWDPVTGVLDGEVRNLLTLPHLDAATPLAELAGRLAHRPPGELDRLRVVLLIGAVEGLSEVPAQIRRILGDDGPTRGFAPDLTPDPGSSAGRQELIAQAFLKELYSGTTLGPAQCTVWRAPPASGPGWTILFNARTGGWVAEELPDRSAP